ncbi:alpha/beta hydrolase [Pedobacter sp. SYSU D00535]|uniref:alpha/beta hydrolase n=1 Tax=Pedobacter sp. SYSU D00535 TaxID=2810308 RepID=UPI001A974551|nr:alpha/beta hydrolase [Pedobacter sp. SYSU D00535]
MIRLILSILLLLVSLLAVLKAPTYHLWLLSVAVTEFPLLLSFLISLVLMSGFLGEQKYQLAGTTVGLIALALSISPIFRAYIVSQNLASKFGKSFPQSAVPPTQPLSFTKLFSGNYDDKVQYQTFIYRNSPQLQLNFYPAQKVGKRPCIVVIHGGSWSSGDSFQLPELNHYLAKAGFHVAAINYRLAPAHHSPSPLEDVQQALAFLNRSHQQLNIDTANFVLLGRSAGAQVALMAAYTERTAAIQGVISLYGPADMVWGYSQPASKWVMDSKKVMEQYLGGTYQEIPEKYFESSPVEFVDKNSPPTLMIHGKNDVLVAYEHNLRLIRRLESASVPHFLLTLPWATHGFDYNLNGPGGQLSTFTVHQFITTVTANKN